MMTGKLHRVETDTLCEKGSFIKHPAVCKVLDGVSTC